MATVQRRLSVIVCADVVGYSRLMGTDEVGTLTSLKAHREATDPLFAEEGGRIVKTTGDGLLLEFPSAFHAVRASLSMQRLMAERNADVPPEKRLVWRMGVHLGDVIVEGNDIFGDGVNIAARLQEIAQPGGICLSQAVHATIHKNIDALFADGGNVALKNIAQPVHVYNLALAGSPSEPPRPAMPQTGPLMSLIVLPFVNLSGDARQDYLVDSVTDHMTAELGRIENSFVVNHATATAYRGDALDVTEIGRELGVRYAIKGSIRPASGGLRANTQLIDTANGQHLWIDRFDIAFGEPFAMQHDIVNRLIPPLHTHLLGASGRAPQSAPAPRAARPAQGGATVVHPRGIPAPVDARAAAHIIAGQPAMRAAPASPRAVVAPPPAVPRRPPMGFTARTAIKLAIVAAIGVAAVTILGAERNAIVEIVSWMPITAGALQIIGNLARGREA